jgi:hypothetical protein
MGGEGMGAKGTLFVVFVFFASQMTKQTKSVPGSPRRFASGLRDRGHGQRRAPEV